MFWHGLSKNKLSANLSVFDVFERRMAETLLKHNLKITPLYFSIVTVVQLLSYISECRNKKKEKKHGQPEYVSLFLEHLFLLTLFSRKYPNFSST